MVTPVAVAQLTASAKKAPAGTSLNPAAGLPPGDPASRQIVVTAWARVMMTSGPNVPGEVPTVTPSASAHATGSA